MKGRWLKLWMLSLVALGLSLVGQTNANAAAPYTLQPLRVTANILRDGDADVTETMTYHFNQDEAGVYNTVGRKGLQKVQLKGVTLRLNHGPEVMVRAADNRAPRTYQLTTTQRMLKVKVQQRVVVGDQLRVTYHYRLRGLVKNYRDTAELNWQIVNDQWAVPLQGVRLRVQLPAHHVTGLQAWTHGSTLGATQVNSRAGRVTMTIATNPANSAISSRMLFPTWVTATNPNRSRQPRKQLVQRQEAKLAAASQAQQRQRKMRQLIGYWGIAAVIVALLVSAGWWLSRHPANRYQQPEPLHHFFELPQVSPGLAESLADMRWPNTDALTGDIMAAASRHEITIVPEAATVRITKTGAVTNAFLQHAFTELGQHESFTMAELEAFSQTDEHGAVGQWFQEWQDEINAAAKDYQDATNITYHQRLWWAAWGLTGAVAVWLLFALVISQPLLIKTLVLSGLLLGLIWGYLWRHTKVTYYNAQGLQAANELRGFRQMLKDIGHFNTAKLGDLILWEQILPYATAFGLTKQVTEQLVIDFGQNQVNTALAAAYPLYFGGHFNQPLAGMIGVGVTSSVMASAPANASVAGHSGSFISGGSGGVGGFGGGVF